MRQKPGSKLGDFMEGKGFYIVLFLCVAAIGISGYYLFSGFMKPNVPVGEAAPTGGQSQVMDFPERETVPLPPATAESKQNAEPEEDIDGEPEEAHPPAVPEETAPEQEPAQESAASNAAAFVWPVNGTVERSFSLEVFAYDATMGDWRTHNGVDIGVELGAQVCACGAGTVTSIEEDDLMGMTVVLDHGNGIESVYANLADSVEVEAGAWVEAGTVLGNVGTSAIAESSGASHLHFEMREYGASVDPIHLLP